jgi:hypothetical protein
LAGGLVAFGQPASAQVQDELRRFLHDDASATLHIRSYFFDRVNAKILLARIINAPHSINLFEHLISMII